MMMVALCSSFRFPPDVLVVPYAALIKHVFRQLVVIVAVFLLAEQLTEASEPRPVFQESFDSASHDGVALKEGASLLSNNHGHALQLPKHAFAVLSQVPEIAAQSGAIAFWLQPRWLENDNQSHVFLTARWDDGKQGYLAISYGWWEPLGDKRLYFVVNNQQSMHCSTPYRFERGQWTHIVVSWSSGTTGRCAIYVDNEKLVELSAPFTAAYKITGPWFIGSDQGATDQRQRSAEFALGDLRIFERSLSGQEIQRLYQAPRAQPFTALSIELDWMSKTLALPAINRRAADGTLRESRVIFDEDIHWAYSKDSAERILQQVKAAGFNVYVPCVWHGGGAYFPNSVADVDTRLKATLAKGYDPLRTLIQRGHELGIEVHPWFTVMLREGKHYPQFHSDGTPDGAYDVHNPLFRDFIVRLMLDVVTRYEVDGINLDYIRSMGICTSNTCKDDYATQTGSGFNADYYLHFVGGDARNRLQAWQDRAVSDIVERVSVGARKVKPRIVISVASHPSPRSAVRPLEGRDDITWANKGWVDVIYAMDYRKRFDDAKVDAVRTELNEPRKLYPLFGNYDQVDRRITPRAGTLMDRYVQFARRKWPDSGIAFYIYSMLSADQRQALRAGAFRETAHTDWPVTASAGVTPDLNRTAQP